MLIKNLPRKKKEIILYKVQAYQFLCWKELPKAFSTIESARRYALAYKLTGKNQGPGIELRIVKRTDNGWEVVE